MFKKTVFLLLGVFSSVCMAAEDFCQLASESIGSKHSELIAVTKINTSKSEIYSTTIEASKDCQHYQPYLSVKNPEVIQSGTGLCMVLPAGEIPPNLCGLQVTLCVTEKSCQSIDILLRKKEGHYIAAEPAYYEMTFQEE